MANAGSARAMSTSRLATRHPWRDDIASTLPAYVDRIRVDPRPCSVEDLHAVDPMSLDRVMQLRRVACCDQLAVAKQANLRGLRRSHVQVDPRVERELLAHVRERKAAGVGELVVGDVAASLAQRVVDDCAVVLE